MLAGSGFGDDAFLSHPTCQKYLSDGIVDLMGTCMIQVFPLQINAASVAFREAFGQIEGRRTAYIVAQQAVEFLTEIVTVQHLPVVVFQLFHTLVKNFGDVCSAEVSVKAFIVYLIRFHCLLFF